jgi:hypothetical protein
MLLMVVIPNLMYLFSMGSVPLWGALSPVRKGPMAQRQAGPLFGAKKAARGDDIYRPGEVRREEQCLISFS